MARLWVVLLPLLLATALMVTADEADDPEGLEPEGLEEYHIYVGTWTECDGVEHTARSLHSDRSQYPDESESFTLVHQPRLGLQRRQIQCKTKDGELVENMYCGEGIKRIGTTRVCVVRQECSLAEWLPWRPRADGALVRTRRLRKLPQGGGKECDVVEEVRPATLEASARWAAGPWGACNAFVEQTATPLPPAEEGDDAEVDDAIYAEDDEVADDLADKETHTYVNCGGGIQKRTAMCVGGDGRLLHPAQCAHVTLPTLVQPCEEPCPRDCVVGEWSEWEPCQPTDGCPLYPVQQLTTTGYSVRRRRVTSAASGGGAPCPPLEEKRTCSTPRCAAWQALPWGPCELNQPHTACGPGRRTREIRCIGHDGKEAQRAWCSASGAPARTEKCRIACAGDCVVSAWGPWSPCSAACASQHPRPTTTRHRHILAHASPNGWPCPPEEQLVQNETCNTHACATYSWLATPWGPCRAKQDSRPDGNYTLLQAEDALDVSDYEEPCIVEGEMTRDVMCVQNNADVVREILCTPLHRPASHRACTIRCRRRSGCYVEAWKPWTKCPNTCEPSQQVRIRRVQGGPNCGATQETRSCPLDRSCTAKHTAWVTGAWSNCKLPPGQRCGHGYRVKNLWCGSDSHREETGACAGQRVPQAVTPCTVSCVHVAPLRCDDVCANPIRFLDASEPDIPVCICKNVTLELLPADSDCILPLGMECGEGRALRAARCLVAGRNVPMDVCKKYHPLTGPNRVREASTDGFTYDEEFSALLRGACTVRCARDCAVGPWGQWGPCSSEPGSKIAFRYRTRAIIEDASGGGRECGATLQQATCTVQQPRWKVGEWSPCALRRHGDLCMRTIVNRTIECVDEDGKRLLDSVCLTSDAGPAPARTTTCHAPCPADCVVSAWSEWSPCEMTKWGGRRDRTRVVLRPAETDGAACPHLVAAEPCTPHTYYWHVTPWDDCQPLGGSPCGEGLKKRSVRCMRSDKVFVNDTFCPNATANEARESWCYVPCGVDCEVREWGEWDTSACSCGDSSNTRHMRRTREHLISAVWPGRACPATEQRAPCHREPCLRLVARPALGCHVLTASGEPAEEACGWGVRISHVRCELSSVNMEPAQDAFLQPWRCVDALPGRIVSVPNHIQEDETCQVECGCPESGARGTPGSWGAWGPCHDGARSRTRQLMLPLTPTCRLASNRYVTIEWANCSGAVAPTHPQKPRPWLIPGYNGYSEEHSTGNNPTSMRTLIISAIVVMVLYVVFLIYRGLFRYFRYFVTTDFKPIDKV